jgi:general secretion pathway protein E
VIANSVEHRLGRLLIDRGLINSGDFDRALELQSERKERLSKVLVDLGYLAQRDAIAAMS